MAKPKSKESVVRSLNKALKEFNSKNKENTYQNYIFVILFYRFLSIDIVNHVKTKYGKNYEKLSDQEAKKLKSEIETAKDYFIYPSDLFQNFIQTRKDDNHLDTILNSIFRDIRKSSKFDICDIFRSIDVENEKVGEDNSERSEILSEVLKAIGSIKYNFEEAEFDLFGFVYEFLLNKYDDNLKISLGNGVYYTQSTLVKLLIEISELYVSNPKNVYDPTCGSGSLLVEYAKHNKNISFFGQEVLRAPYGLCKMNMILHNVKDYHITNADTLLTYNKDEKEKFDLILSNPPFSVKWNNSLVETDDERFNHIPILPPNNYADYAFIYHIVHALNQNGIALVIDGPGMLSRTNEEETRVREHLVKENLIDAIIQLPNNFFLRTKIGACLFIIRKNKKDNKILFVDATTKYTTINHTRSFSDDNAKEILDLITLRENIDDLSYLATPEEIASKNYILSVETYIKYKKKNSFKPLGTNSWKDFIYAEEEYNNYLLRKRFSEDIIKVNQYILKKINQFTNNNDVKTIKLSDLAISIKSGSKLNQIGATTNDNSPYCYITSKEIQNGAVMPITTIKTGDGRDKEGTQKINEEALKKFLELSNLERYDVLFTLSETGPKTAIVDEPNFGFNETIFAIKPIKDKINPLYLRYLLESEYMANQISENLSYSNAKYISIEKFRNLSIPDIPLEIQTEISMLLTSLDIEYTRLETALERERDIYKYRHYTHKNRIFDSLSKIDE